MSCIPNNECVCIILFNVRIQKLSKLLILFMQCFGHTNKSTLNATINMDTNILQIIGMLNNVVVIYTRKFNYFVMNIYIYTALAVWNLFCIEQYASIFRLLTI